MPNDNNSSSIGSTKTNANVIEDTLKPTRSRFCQLLPVFIFLITFASVLSLLIAYTFVHRWYSSEYRHEQFRQNLTRDYDLINTPQDSKELIWFLREVLLKKYQLPNLERLPMDEFNYNTSSEVAASMAKTIGRELFHDKKNGFFVQSLTGSNGDMMTAPWLTESQSWNGIIMEPDPRKYFSYRKLFAQRNTTIVHAAVSPAKYPKEVTLHYEEEDTVKIESLREEPERIKCFPLYTVLLAFNQTTVDLLSLGCQGTELEILQTVPWDKVNIKVISIHLIHFSSRIDYPLYVSTLIGYLNENNYKMVWHHDRNFIFQKVQPDAISKPKN